MHPGKAQYTHLLDDADGSVADDIIVWWLGEDLFDVMPNASNTTRVLDALGGQDTTSERVVLAIQGPHARAKLKAVCDEAASIAAFQCRLVRLARSRTAASPVPVTRARTAWSARSRSPSQPRSSKR